MWSELAPDAGMLSGGRGEGLGSRSGFQGGMPAHLHPCMLRILLPRRGARRVDPPAPAVLPVCSEVGLRGWGALAVLGGEIWGPSRSCPACPELVSRGLAFQVGGCGQTAWEPEGPEVPTAGPGAQAMLGPSMCVSQLSPHLPHLPWASKVQPWARRFSRWMLALPLQAGPWPHRLGYSGAQPGRLLAYPC